MRVEPCFSFSNDIFRAKLLNSVSFISHGFTTKLGGVSKDVYSSLNLGLNTEDDRYNVLKNYEIAAEKIGFDIHRLVLTKQVHSDNIRIVSSKDAGKGVFLDNDLKDTDALVTNEPNLPIGVFTADCTPVLLCDINKKVIGAVHSGWKGTLSSITNKTVMLMQKNFHVNPKDILCAIGPSIKKCCFEVKNDVYSLFCEKFGKNYMLDKTTKSGESYFIDTDSIIVDSLVSMGILEENINVCKMCTYDNPDLFFSHRKSGGKTGRQCAFIVIK